MLHILFQKLDSPQFLQCQLETGIHLHDKIE